MPDVSLSENAANTMDNVVRGQASRLVDDQDGVHETIGPLSD